jgi:peptide/histidine transporter 3/4
VLFFQTKLNMSNEDAVNQFYAWNGFVYVTPLIGGYIADTLLGRYKTILYFSCLYLIGLALFVFGSVPGAISLGLIFTAMYTVALGAGGIKPNVSTMGADQFDPKYAQDKKESAQFFSYFYWSINLGALLAYSLVAYVCQYGLPFLGGEPWGFFVGYLIPTVMMCFGVAVFVSGSNSYKKVRPSGSMLTTASGILYESLITRYSVKSPTGFLLDKASEQYGGSFAANDVEGVKYVAKLTPFLGVMIPYWGIYGQTKTAFQIQGCQMDSQLGDFQLPISAMNMFNNVAILALVPLTDQVFYPYLKKKGYNLTMLNKIGWGFLFATLAMVVAALIELYRLQQAPSAGDYYDQSARDNISPCRNIDDYDPYQYQQWYHGDDVDKPQNCNQICDTILDDDNHYLSLDCIDCDDIPQMSNISIFWQIPQFVLIGVSEIFASITSLEFFYSQAPSRMRSVSQASNLFTNALGSWLTIPLTLLVNVNPNHQWITSNVDQGNLQAYFYLLAGLMSGALVLFTYLSAGYEYVDPVVLAALDTASDNSASQATASLLANEEMRAVVGEEDDNDNRK